MNENLNQEVLDKLTKVCLCKGITRATIKKAIREGATSVEEVNSKVGSGSGGCKGRRCGEKIETLIAEYNED